MSLDGPYAISWEDLLDGIHAGKYPKVAALTAPAFGLPGSHMGSILSLDPAAVTMARAHHIEVLERTAYLKEEGLGLGVAIWWPAFDAITRWLKVPRGEAWERLKAFWIELLRETGGELHL